MSNSQSTVTNLIRSVAQKNPTLYSALQLMIDDLYKVYGEVFPGISSVSASSLATGLPDDVAGFSAQAFPTNLRLNWNAATNAVSYEIRVGADWATGTYVITTSQLVANLDPIILNLTYGSHIFWIKGINSSGAYSVDAESVTLSVPTIGSPALTGQGIANNALLSWSAPTSTWLIAYYIIYRNGTDIGHIAGNFKISSEVIGGTYSYTVKAVDIVGNVSDESPALVLTLDDPIDLIFIGSQNATLTGTYSNCKEEMINGLDGIIGPIDITKTFEDHFIDNAWATPQDQIDAGYPYYIQPIEASGYYEEVFDFGAIYDNVTILAYYSLLAIVGATGIDVEISYSTDDITYTAPVTGTALLATSVRYVKVRWTFTNGNDLDFAFIYGLKCSISTQLVLDSGSGTAVSTDVAGTVINFNRTFKNVNSVTCTANSTTPLTLVVDNVTTTTFNIYAFDNAGVRVTTDFFWKARGII